MIQKLLQTNVQACLLETISKELVVAPLVPSGAKTLIWVERLEGYELKQDFWSRHGESKKHKQRKESRVVEGKHTKQQRCMFSSSKLKCRRDCTGSLSISAPGASNWNQSKELRVWSSTTFMTWLPTFRTWQPCKTAHMTAGGFPELLETQDFKKLPQVWILALLEELDQRGNAFRIQEDEQINQRNTVNRVPCFFSHVFYK